MMDDIILIDDQEIEDLPASCGCRSFDAGECVELRYGRDRADSFGKCDCLCHDDEEDE